MKIFVTGGTGFIGSNFIKHAIAHGHNVVAQKRHGSYSRIPLVQEPIWIERGLDQNFQVELAGCEAIVHFASHTPNPPYAPIHECMYWNVLATTNLIMQAANLGIENVVIAGSCFEYGSAADGLDYIHPGTEMRPSETYPISKAAATLACLGLARNLGLRLQVLRIFQVFGEGESENRFWPSMRSAAKTGRDFQMSAGLQIRDFINVCAVVEQFHNALQFRKIERGHPVIRNVGTGKAQTLLEFATYWWDKWGATGKLLPGTRELRPGEPLRLVANIEDVHVC